MRKTQFAMGLIGAGLMVAGAFGLVGALPIVIGAGLLLAAISDMSAHPEQD